MSRIHEAMQKAAQELAQPSDVASFPFESETAPEGGANPTSAIFTSADPASGTLSQFDDLQKRCTPATWRPDPKSSFFTNPALSTVGAEQFRTLRSRLYQLRATQPVRKILVTSALSGEGKTFVAANLALAIAHQGDRRVLLIDADLRSSRLHGVLGTSAEPGVSDYLRGDIDEVKGIQSDPACGLYFIPSGTRITNPSELLSNGRMKQLLDRLAPLFDWVIVDSPPCLPVADALVVADFCDALLLVVKSGSTPSEIAQRARHELGSRNILGIVLNAVDEKALAYSLYQTYAARVLGTAKESTSGISD